MKILWMFLEWLGLRCAKCGSNESKTTVVKKLEWGSNVGGLLLMDPYYVKFKQKTCSACGHTLSSVYVGTEVAVET